MYLYVELWKPRPAWNALPVEQREEFLSRLAKGTEQMEALGVELTGFCLCDEGIPFDGGFKYMAVWKMPNQGHAYMLDKAVRAEGWENYFEILHARGSVTPVSALMKEMLRY